MGRRLIGTSASRTGTRANLKGPAAGAEAGGVTAAGGGTAEGVGETVGGGDAGGTVAGGVHRSGGAGGFVVLTSSTLKGRAEPARRKGRDRCLGSPDTIPVRSRSPGSLRS